MQLEMYGIAQIQFCIIMIDDKDWNLEAKKHPCDYQGYIDKL